MLVINKLNPVNLILYVINNIIICKFIYKFKLNFKLRLFILVRNILYLYLNNSYYLLYNYNYYNTIIRISYINN